MYLETGSYYIALGSLCFPMLGLKECATSGSSTRDFTLLKLHISGLEKMA